MATNQNRAHPLSAAASSVPQSVLAAMCHERHPADIVHTAAQMAAARLGVSKNDDVKLITDPSALLQALCLALPLRTGDTVVRYKNSCVCWYLYGWGLLSCAKFHPFIFAFYLFIL